MEAVTKVIGKTIRHMVGADLCTPMAMSISVNALRLKLRAQAFIFTLMVRATLVTGKMTNSMGKGMRHGLMVLATKEATSTVKSMV